MRRLIEKTIIENWVRGLDEMTNVAYIMGWDEVGYGGTRHVNGHLLIYQVANTELRNCIRECSDVALLAWLDAQLCQKYR